MGSSRPDLVHPVLVVSPGRDPAVGGGELHHLRDLRQQGLGSGLSSDLLGDGAESFFSGRPWRRG